MGCLGEEGGERRGGWKLLTREVFVGLRARLSRRKVEGGEAYPGRGRGGWAGAAGRGGQGLRRRQRQPLVELEVGAAVVEGVVGRRGWEVQSTGRMAPVLLTLSGKGKRCLTCC